MKFFGSIRDPSAWIASLRFENSGSMPRNPMEDELSDVEPVGSGALQAPS